MPHCVLHSSVFGCNFYPDILAPPGGVESNGDRFKSTHMFMVVILPVLSLSIVLGNDSPRAFLALRSETPDKKL